MPACIHALLNILSIVFSFFFGLVFVFSLAGPLIRQKLSLIYSLFQTVFIKCLLFVQYFWLGPVVINIVTFIIFLFLILGKTLSWNF